MRLQLSFCLVTILFVISSAGFCETGQGKEPSPDSVHKHQAAVVSSEESVGSQDIGIDEKLGSMIPLNLAFHDEDDLEVTLGQLITKPTVVALVFFSCRTTCPLLLGGLADTLGKVGLEAKEDYTVLAISFDPKDTPQIASEAKVNYIQAVGKPFPEEAWRFLTGSRESIMLFTEAVGFKFTEQRGGFTHPVALIVLSPKGKITRYLYGTSFLPFDVTMALREAAEEREGLSMNKVLLYCFSYNPEEKKYVFNVLRVVGISTLLFVTGLFIFLVISTKRVKDKIKNV